MPECQVSGGCCSSDPRRPAPIRADPRKFNARHPEDDADLFEQDDAETLEQCGVRLEKNGALLSTLYCSVPHLIS